MRRLEFRVGLGHLRPRLAQPKVELSEQALALSHLQLYPEFLVEKGGQSRAVPHLPGQAKLRWAGAKRGLHFGQLAFTQPTGPASAKKGRQKKDAKKGVKPECLWLRAGRVVD